MNKQRFEAVSLAEQALDNVRPDAHSPERFRHNAHGSPLDWGATPLLISPETQQQQDEVRGFLDMYFQDAYRPDFVSSSLGRYIDTLNMARTAHRESKNRDSFAYRRNMRLENVPMESLELIDRATRGYASPAELLHVMEILEMPSIELASVTHPYGYRIHHLEDMRPAVEEAITLHYGSLFQGKAAKPTYEVKGSDNPHSPADMTGIHMTRKTPIGVLPDGTKIIERSSFVLLLDRLPQECQEVIRTIPFENNKFWANRVRRAGKLYEKIPALLKEDRFEVAIPVSTTVVARNEALEAELLNEEARRERSRLLATHSISLI